MDERENTHLCLCAHVHLWLLVSAAIDHERIRPVDADRRTFLHQSLYLYGFCELCAGHGSLSLSHWLLDAVDEGSDSPENRDSICRFPVTRLHASCSLGCISCLCVPLYMRNGSPGYIRSAPHTANFASGIRATHRRLGRHGNRFLPLDSAFHRTYPETAYSSRRSQELFIRFSTEILLHRLESPYVYKLACAVFVALVAITAAGVVSAVWSKRAKIDVLSLLPILFAVFFFTLSFTVPEFLIGGSYLGERFSIYWVVFLITGAAAIKPPRWCTSAVGIVALAGAMVILYSQWHYLSDTARNLNSALDVPLVKSGSLGAIVTESSQIGVHRSVHLGGCDLLSRIAGDSHQCSLDRLEVHHASPEKDRALDLRRPIAIRAR